jgi:signal transduction histidine kinase
MIDDSVGIGLSVMFAVVPAATALAAMLHVHQRMLRLEVANRELARAAERSDRANKAKSDYIASMNHELRTPLNAIIGFGQLLESEAFESSPERRREITGHIVDAGLHLLALVNETLDLAGIEAGKISLTLERVMLAELFSDCRTMISPLTERSGIRLEFPRECALGVVADRLRLKQVMLNLLSNAVKYNRSHGMVAIACEKMAGNRVRISIKDEGSGLRPDQLQSMFQPFNRLEQVAGSKEGSGIGLVITKRLIESMRGCIGVSSAIGQGSVFWFDLDADETTDCTREFAPFGLSKAVHLPSTTAAE